MPDSEVNIRVNTDLASTEAAAKRLTSVFDEAGSTGAARFSELRGKVGELSVQLGKLKQDLTSATDPATVGRLNAALAQTSQQLSAARTEMKGMSLASREASETLGLLSAQMGIQIPEGMKLIIARSPGVQQALGAAFNGVMVGALIAGLVEVGGKINEVISVLGGLTEATKAMGESAAAASNKALVTFSTLKAGAFLLGQTQTEIKNNYEELQRQQSLLPNGAKEWGAAIAGLVNPLVAVNSAAYVLWNRWSGINELSKEGKELDGRRLVQLNQLGDIGDKVTTDAKAGAEKAAAATAKWVQEQESLRIAFAGDALAAVKMFADIEKKTEEAKAVELKFLHPDYSQALKGMNDYFKNFLGAGVDVEKGISAIDKETQQAHSQSLTGMARIEYESAEQIVKIHAQAQELITADAGQGSVRRVDIERAEANAIAAVQAEEVNKLAGQINDFIDRVFMQAKSIADVFHQFLMQMVSSVVKSFSQMLAASLLSVRQAGAQGSGNFLSAIFGGGGGGGGFGSILGSMFGLGGGGSATGSVAGGGTSSALGMSGASYESMFAPAALPLTDSAAGLVSYGGPSAAGGASSGLLGGLAFSPGKMLPSLEMMAPTSMALAGMGLLGSAASSGGPVKGALGGALLGAGGFATIAGIATASQGAGMMAGIGLALTNPITAVIAGIGAAIGALLGAFGRVRAKTKAAQTEQTYEFAADSLFKQFKDYQTDYGTALQGMEDLIAQGVVAEKASGTGKWGQKGAANLTMVINNEITALKNLQSQRQANATAMGAMTIPEFPGGGLMRGDGHQLAWILPGEFVVRREAVSNLGVDFLAAINRAPAIPMGGSVGPGMPRGVGSGVTIHGNVNIHPGPGMSRQQAMRMWVQACRNAQRQGAI